MAKKKSPKKKGSPKTKGSPKKGKTPKQEVYDDSWRKDLIESTINDLQSENINVSENWSMMVAMINPAGNNLEVEYLKHFEKQAIEGDRSVIKYVSFEETMFMINQIGSETYNHSSDICYPQVFKEANKLLDSGNGKISSEVMGMLIKSQLLTMKQTDLKIQRQKEEVIDGLKRESEALVLDKSSSKNKGKGKGKKSPEKNKKASPKKGKNNKKKENVTKKFATDLRIRGEEWRDKVYIDDHPIEGPNLYVALTNFLDAELPKNLLELQVPLLGVVRLKIYPNPDSSNNLTSPRMISEQEVYEEYWRTIEKYRFEVTTSDFYKSLSFFSFFPPYKPIDIEIDACDDTKDVYHDISYLLYDFSDLQRQHFNYLSNMDVHTVASPSDERIEYEKYASEFPPSECFNELFVLNCLINAISHDYENPIHIRKSLSEKISKIEVEESFNIPKLFSKPEVSESFHKKEMTSSNEKCPSVEIFKDSQTGINNMNKEYKYMKDLIVINDGDSCKQLAYHLDDIYSTDMQNITSNILNYMPFSNLFSCPQTNNEIIGNSDYYCYLTFMGEYLIKHNVNALDIRQFITLLICQKLHDNYPFMNLVPPTLMEEYKIRYLKRTVSTKLLKKRSISKTSFHYCQCDVEIDRFDETLCPDICEILVKQFCSIMKKFNMLEYLDRSILLQKIYSAFNNYNSMKHKYDKITDSVCIIFSNRYDYDRIFTKEWQNHIPTPVCLQDFFDYIIDENYEWIKLQEEIYDEKMAIEYEKRRKKLDSSVSIFPPRFCLDAEYIDPDLLIDGSLKFDLWVKSMTQDDDAKKKKKEKSPREKKGKGEGSGKKTSPKEKSQKEKSPKKTSPKKVPTEKGSAKTTNKKKTAPEEKPAPETEGTKPEADKSESDFRTEIKPKYFLGYNLSDRRIQVLGKDMTYFCKDGCQISSSYTMHTYPSCVEEFGLKICVNKHSISMHREQPLSPLKKDKSFVITTESGALMSFKEYIGFDVNTEKACSRPVSKKLSDHQINVIHSIQLVDYSKSSNHHQHMGAKSESNTSNESKCGEKWKSSSSQFQSKYFGLTLSWPSSLTIETVHENKSSFPLYIKQKYLSKGPECCSITDEMFRCMSLNGEVLIFKLDGQIKILRSNSLYVKYVDYQCINEVNDVIMDETLSTTSDGTSITQKSDTMHKKLPQKQGLGKGVSNEKIFDEEIGEYGTEYIEGKDLKQRTSEVMYMEKLLSESERYYHYGEMYIRTPDGINSLLNKDGLLTVSFLDGTQITSHFVEEDLNIYPEWTSEELLKYFRNSGSELMAESETSGEKSTFRDPVITDESYVFINMIYTMEHPNYSTVTSNRSSNTLSMKMPDDTEIIINSDRSYRIHLDDTSNVLMNNEKLHVSYEACHCGPYFSKIDVNLNFLTESGIPESTEWAKIVDSCGKTVSVDIKGLIQVKSAVEDFVAEFSKEDTEEPCYEPCKFGAGDSARAEEDKVENVSPMHTDQINYLYSTTGGEEINYISTETSQQNNGDGRIYSNGRHEDCICSAPKLHEDRRFFVLNRNNTGEELYHDDFVEKYLQDCKASPFGYIYENTCPCEDQSGKTTKVTFKPVTDNQSQKWIMKPMYPSKPSTFSDCLCGDDIHRMTSTKKLPKVFTIRSMEPILAKDIPVDLEEMKALLLSFHKMMTSEEKISPCHSCLCISEQDQFLQEQRNGIRKRAIDGLTSELEKMRTEPWRKTFRPPCGENKIDVEHQGECIPFINQISEENTEIGEIEEEELRCDCSLESSSTLSSVPQPKVKALRISEECNIILSAERISDSCDCKPNEAGSRISLSDEKLSGLCECELNEVGSRILSSDEKLSYICECEPDGVGSRILSSDEKLSDICECEPDEVGSRILSSDEKLSDICECEPDRTESKTISLDDRLSDVFDCKPSEIERRKLSSNEKISDFCEIKCKTDKNILSDVCECGPNERGMVLEAKKRSNEKLSDIICDMKPTETENKVELSNEKLLSDICDCKPKDIECEVVLEDERLSVCDCKPNKGECFCDVELICHECK